MGLVALHKNRRLFDSERLSECIIYETAQKSVTRFLSVYF